MAGRTLADAMSMHRRAAFAECSPSRIERDQPQVLGAAGGECHDHHHGYQQADHDPEGAWRIPEELLEEPMNVAEAKAALTEAEKQATLARYRASAEQYGKVVAELTEIEAEY